MNEEEFNNILEQVVEEYRDNFDIQEKENGFKYYVYKTTNIENQKIYIGVHKSKDIENDSYIGSGYILKKSITKYGKESFKREILFEFDTPEEAFAKEREIVNEEFILREDVYNMVLGGHGGQITLINPFFGKTHSDETKKLLSDMNKGKKLTEETKQKISKSLRTFHDNMTDEEYVEYIKKFPVGENAPFYGRHHSEKSKELMRLNNIGRKHTEESKKKMSENSPFKGVPKSEEFKKHLSELYKGKKNPWNQITNRNPEKIRKTAEKHRGMKRSEEACKNISQSKIGKQKGCNNNEFIGYWITPYGKFDSLKSASESIGNSEVCIWNRCLTKNNNKILRFSFVKDDKIREEDIGKTWKEIGWGFEPVNKKVGE